MAGSLATRRLASPGRVTIVLTYILRRLLMLIPVMLGVTLLTFAISQLTPGDPAVLLLGDFATAENVARLRAELGLDDPLWMQYLRYLWNALHGDLGVSIRGQTPVTSEILAHLPHTVALTLAAMLITLPLGLGAGIFAATVKRRVIDGTTMVVALAGLSVPNFWLALVLLLVFGVNLGWVAVIGGEGLKDLILPAITLGLGPAAVLARLTRSSMLEVLHDDYVRTARAKGATEHMVTLRHVLPNALIPVVTVIGLQFSQMMIGTVFVESVFARPGLGRFAVSAIAARDYPQIQGVVLFAALVFVLVNLAVDLLYPVLDPRIRLNE